MWVGKYEQSAFIITDLFEILEIHLIGNEVACCITLLPQWIPHHFMSVTSWRQEKRMVDRWLHYHFLVLVQEEVDNHADALHNAGNVGQPFSFHLPLMLCLNPLLNCGPVVFWPNPCRPPTAARGRFVHIFLPALRASGRLFLCGQQACQNRMSVVLCVA